MHRLTRLSAAIGLSLSSAIWANADADQSSNPKQLEDVRVTASPFQQGVDEIAKPVEILHGAELDRQKTGTIGETVASQPGVQTSFFGAGVGRPIVRGMEGGRVQVLSGGVGSMDASNISADHAVSIEPFLADQIEVLKGPSSLLFGSGAIGGVVNVVDGRIPSVKQEGLKARAEVRTATGNNEWAGMARMDYGFDQVVLHADAFKRDADDFEVPNQSEPLENSAVATQGAALGATIFGDIGSFGLSFNRFETLYGIPGEAEETESLTSIKGRKHEGEESVRIDMQQNRLDAKLSLDEPVASLKNVTVKFGHNDYEHVELEGDEIGTQFFNDAKETRIEAVHQDWNDWQGSFGLQMGRRDFAAIGEEALAPPSLTKELGLFWVEQIALDRWKLDLGARLDQRRVSTDLGQSAKHNAASLSLSSRFALNDDWSLLFNLDRAARAPSAEELFSDGPHIATRGYEVGDADLDTEIAKQVELGLDYQGERIGFRGAMFQNRFDRFIYLDDTNDSEDGLPVRVWSQDDAKFTGIEAELKIALANHSTGTYDLRLFGDQVRAELTNGENLPRIAPARMGAQLQWSLQGFNASLGAVRVLKQDDVAALETATPGYTLINADISHRWEGEHHALELFAQARNLTDQLAFAHTSFLKDFAPLPGRTFVTGVRWEY